LSSDLLEELIDIITLPNELDQASIGAIVRNLYPATKVPDECVVRVVGSLGHGQAKARLSVQSGLLKWLIMVYDVLENRGILSQLYSLLFNLLDTTTIRLGLCVVFLSKFLTVPGHPYAICYHL
jgi:centromere protein I